MTLWRISAKNNWNWGTGKQLVKGMFIELSTPTTTPPLGVVSYHEVIAKAFNTKYSTNFDKSKMNASYLICEKLGKCMKCKTSMHRVIKALCLLVLANSSYCLYLISYLLEACTLLFVENGLNT